MLAVLLCNLPGSGDSPLNIRLPESFYRKRYDDDDEPFNLDAQIEEVEQEVLESVEDVEEVKKAIFTLTEAEYVPESIREAKEILHKRSLVDELDNYKPDTDYVLVCIMRSYLYYCDWKARDEEDIALLLLLT